jgi:hypothetical protein
MMTGYLVGPDLLFWLLIAGCVGVAVLAVLGLALLNRPLRMRHAPPPQVKGPTQRVMERM